MMIGTSTGREAPWPGGWSMRIRAPSHSIVSPCSRPRYARMYASMNAQGIAR
jgi:hypothetical protein